MQFGYFSCMRHFDVRFEDNLTPVESSAINIRIYEAAVLNGCRQMLMLSEEPCILYNDEIGIL